MRQKSGKKRVFEESGQKVNLSSQSEDGFLDLGGNPRRFSEYLAGGGGRKWSNCPSATAMSIAEKSNVTLMRTLWTILKIWTWWQRRLSLFIWVCSSCSHFVWAGFPYLLLIAVERPHIFCLYIKYIDLRYLILLWNTDFFASFLNRTFFCHFFAIFWVTPLSLKSFFFLAYFRDFEVSIFREST